MATGVRGGDRRVSPDSPERDDRRVSQRDASTAAAFREVQTVEVEAR